MALMAKEASSYSKGAMERMQPGLPKKLSPMVMIFIYTPISTSEIFHREAKDRNFDVVLIDTAGRMQDNEV